MPTKTHKTPWIRRTGHPIKHKPPVLYLPKPECQLSPYNSDFELLIYDNGTKCKTRQESGFQWLWKAAKTNYGVFAGKFFFEVRILEKRKGDLFKGSLADEKNFFTKTTLEDPVFKQEHAIRIGWSTFNSQSNLGMDSEGYGYENNGYKYHQGEEREYGETYKEGDVIRCCIDLQETFTISYHKNGVSLGRAFSVPEERKREGFYPHICIRNIAFEVNFGQQEVLYPITTQEICVDDIRQDPEKNLAEIGQEEQKEEGDLVKKKEYQFINNASIYKIEMCPEPPKDFKDCMVIFLVGLPYCGKTTYADRFASRNYRKHFQILGTFQIYEHIVNTVRIPNLKENILSLMEICNDIFQKSLVLAARIKQNYIIDQCNVVLRSRLQKLNIFEKFHKEAYVMVLSEEEYTNRLSKKRRFLNQNENMFYPRLCRENVRYLKENFILPDETEGFDKIKYIGLNEEDARKMVALSCEIAKYQVHPLLREKTCPEIQETGSDEEKDESYVPRFNQMRDWDFQPRFQKRPGGFYGRKPRRDYEGYPEGSDSFRKWDKFKHKRERKFEYREAANELNRALMNTDPAEAGKNPFDIGPAPNDFENKETQEARKVVGPFEFRFPEPTRNEESHGPQRRFSPKGDRDREWKFKHFDKRGRFSSRGGHGHQFDFNPNKPYFK